MHVYVSVQPDVDYIYCTNKYNTVLFFHLESMP